MRNLLRRWLKPARAEQELDAEVRSYFDIQVERQMERGLSYEEALRKVHLTYEGPEQIKHDVREARMGSTIDSIGQDIAYAARVLIKSPGFTIFAVLTIALGLGANAAIFSLVDGVLLKSAGYPEPERMVQLWEKPPRGLRNGIAGANFIDWTRQSTSFESMAAMTGANMSFNPGGGEPQSLRVGVVSAPYFDVFGVKPALGRTFAKDEDQPEAQKVVVLTHRIWMGRFGADASVVGRKIHLNGEPYQVIGVLPGASEFDRRSQDMWIPLVFPANVARDYHYLGAVARLKRSVTVEQARTEMSAIADGIAKAYPAQKKDWGVTIDRYLDRVVGDQMRLSLKVLMLAVIAVLLIGCANLANLLMARATLRSREIALRMALGARRGRIIRMLLTESLMLAALGATVGIALGYGLLSWIKGLLPPFYFPSESQVNMDGRVMLFLGLATVFTSILFGLMPAIEASRRDSAESLKEGGRTGSGGRTQYLTRHIFVAAQVGLAFILLVGGGLLLRSFQNLMNVDIGFRTEGLVAGYLPMAREGESEATKLTQYIRQILEEVHSVPGVTDAAVTTGIPLRGWGDGMPMWMPDKPDDTVFTGFKIITPRYFQALGLRVLAGRVLDDRDQAGTPPVVVVNESFVKRYFPGQNAVGKRILVEKILPTRRGLGPKTAWEIVGVVADEKARGVDVSSDVGTYASFAQTPVSGLGLVAKGTGSREMLLKTVQRALWKVNKDQVLDRPMTVEQLKTESLMSRRLMTSLIAGFSFLALLLACAGIYGVLSFVTARRTQEMGIRSAMGATRSDLIRLVIGGGVKPVLAGIALGFAGALALTRFVESMLFGTQPIDPPTLTAVVAIFLTVALAACLIPAWRAASTDPMSALRQD